MKARTYTQTYIHYGRTVDFDDWQLDADPVALLTQEELAAMEFLVERLTA
jgi:hypothetical protein